MGHPAVPPSLGLTLLVVPSPLIPCFTDDAKCLRHVNAQRASPLAEGTMNFQRLLTAAPVSCQPWAVTHACRLCCCSFARGLRSAGRRGRTGAGPRSVPVPRRYRCRCRCRSRPGAVPGAPEPARRQRRPWRCRWPRCGPGTISSPARTASPCPTSRTSRNGTTAWSATCSTTRPTT